MNSKKKIAVIGSGAAGLTAAYLLNARYEITLFEKNDYLGGHTNTLTIPDGPDAGTPVDTGFIVYNDRNYPTLLRLFERLGIKGQPSDMSFGVNVPSINLQYSSYVPDGLFAQKRNYFRPVFWRMISDILRFNKEATADLMSERLGDQTLGSYLRKGSYSRPFMDYYLIPMGAAIWSTPCGQMLDFPASTFMRFFHNHGLLGLKGRPSWMTVPGGSQSYVKVIRRELEGKYRVSLPAEKIKRTPDAVFVTTSKGTESFDFAVVAAHADEAYRLLSDPDADEARLLGPWTYSKNRAILHWDESVMPSSPKAWASWNYHRDSEAPSAPVSLSYHMNRLQSLKTRRQYFVSLNLSKLPERPKIIREIDYMHPVYTPAALRTQKELPGLNGRRRTYFCGSYFGYGFHEDAVKSGMQAAGVLGVTL